MGQREAMWLGTERGYVALGLRGALWLWDRERVCSLWTERGYVALGPRGAMLPLD